MALKDGTSRRVRQTWEILWNDGRGWVLLAISLGWALTIGTRIVYPALLPDIRLEFGFGYSTTGVLVGIVWAAYGLFQLPGGLLADTTTHRTALVAGTVITAIGIGAVVWSPVFGVFVLATAVMGAGTGIYGPSRVAVLSNTYPDYDSTAIGVSQAAGNLGNAALPALAGLLSAYAGWRLGLGYLAPLLVLGAVGLWVTVPVASHREGRSATLSELLVQTRNALTSRSVYSGTALLLLIMFVYQSLTGFLPTYLVDEKGLSSPVAATLYGGFFATAILVQIGAGSLADRFGIQRVVTVFAAASLPGVLLLITADGLGALVISVVLLSCLLGCFPPAHAYTIGVVPPEIQGTGYGVIRTVYIGCGAAGPIMTGMVAEFASFPIAVFTLGIFVTGIIAVGYLLPSEP